MSRKIGEAQAIDFFGTALREMHEKNYGKEANYSVGIFSGSQDRKFADFFAGIGSTCILIEFKEFENEIKHELRKELRENLCKNLNETDAALSRGAHYIAYRSKAEDMQLRIAPYVDVVCPDFGIGQPPLLPFLKKDHENFINDFLSSNAGCSYDNFVRYAGYMSAIAGSTPNGLKTRFRAIFYSRNHAGTVVGTIFKNLSDFKKMMDKKPSRKMGPI